PASPRSLHTVRPSSSATDTVRKKCLVAACGLAMDPIPRSRKRQSRPLTVRLEMSLHCRLLPFQTASGAWNMAADDALLESAAGGIASLRFYTFETPTLSLGYFQNAAHARSLPQLAGLPWVRRPSGGAALVHHHELTYALALPPGLRWQSSWIPRFHTI